MHFLTRCLIHYLIDYSSALSTVDRIMPDCRMVATISKEATGFRTFLHQLSTTLPKQVKRVMLTLFLKAATNIPFIDLIGLSLGMFPNEAEFNSFAYS